MKKLILVAMTCIGMLSVTAQNLSVTFNGANQNRYYQVVIDGVSYYSNATMDANTTSNGTIRTISIPGLALGSHTVAVYRLRNNAGVYNNGTGTATGRAMYENTVQLRSGYDMRVTVNGNGGVSITERRVRTRGGTRNQTYVSPMNAATYDALLRNTRARWSQSQRISALNTAFAASTGNYFTTAQARQLLLLINTEENRLPLAKLSYSRITDPANFSSLYDLFSNITLRNELNTHTQLYPNYNNGYNSNNGTGTVITTNTRVAVDDATYNTLYQKASGHILPWNRTKEVNALFTGPDYFFNVAQINKLLSVVADADKLELAKLSWNRVADPVNFNQIINLFSSQADRDALNAYMQSHPF